MINIDLHDGWATITLNRPDKRNALSRALLRDFKRALEQVQQCRAVILRGEGPIFCAGMDLIEASDPTQLEEMASLLADVFIRLRNLPAITVALVHGGAMGGGAGLMMACDLAFATPESKIAFPEVLRGLVPAQVMSFLIRQLQVRHIRELTLLGDGVSAERAVQIGLLNGVVQNLDEKLEAVLESIGRTAPVAVKETKKLIDVMMRGDFTQDLIKGFEVNMRLRESVEAKEGTAAFKEKRKPNWSKPLQ